MKTHIVIPIESGPRLTAAEIAAFVARETAAGRNPDESIAAMVAAAIRTNDTQALAKEGLAA